MKLNQMANINASMNKPLITETRTTDWVVRNDGLTRSRNT